MSLKIENEIMKKTYFEYLRDFVHIPICINCEKLFELGFPKTEEALSDYLICKENDLICSCENYKKFKESCSKQPDDIVDISGFYK